MIRIGSIGWIALGALALSLACSRPIVVDPEAAPNPRIVRTDALTALWGYYKFHYIENGRVVRPGTRVDPPVEAWLDTVHPRGLQDVVGAPSGPDRAEVAVVRPGVGQCASPIRAAGVLRDGRQSQDVALEERISRGFAMGVHCYTFLSRLAHQPHRAPVPPRGRVGDLQPDQRSGRQYQAAAQPVDGAPHPR